MRTKLNKLFPILCFSLNQHLISSIISLKSLSIKGSLSVCFYLGFIHIRRIQAIKYLQVVSVNLNAVCRNLSITRITFVMYLSYFSRNNRPTPDAALSVFGFPLHINMCSATLKLPTSFFSVSYKAYISTLWFQSSIMISWSLLAVDVAFRGASCIRFPFQNCFFLNLESLSFFLMLLAQSHLAFAIVLY